MAEETKPDCRECAYSRKLIFTDTAISCRNPAAKITSKRRGATHAIFDWPWEFDPAALLTCDGFRKKEAK